LITGCRNAPSEGGPNTTIETFSSAAAGDIVLSNPAMAMVRLAQSNQFIVPPLERFAF
jgi:hypothetical protein